MSRLPHRLQPAWPLFKRAHRGLAMVLGVLFRSLSPVLGSRGLPRRATTYSRDTARLDPSATYHPGGDAEHLERSLPVGSPADHWRFHAELSVRVPERYVLELRQGTVVGDVGAVVTGGGVFDYQTSGYFGLASWREHPLFLAPRLPRHEHVDGALLNLTTRGAAGNYYHFLLDALPRLGILEECLPGTSADAVIVPHAARYQRELLELLGVRGRLVQPRPRLALTADRLLVPSTPNQDLAAPTWVVYWLRERLLPSGVTETPARLYLTRGDRPHTRRYVQETDLWPELARRGFTLVDPGTLSVQEQIDLFTGAEVVVAPHGAGLTNVLFCRPGTRVLELFADSYVHLGLWAIAEAIGGIDYRYLVADGTHPRGRPMVGVLEDIRIPVPVVLAHVDALLARESRSHMP